MQYQAERLPEQLRFKVSGQGKERGRQRGLSALQLSCDGAAVLTATASLQTAGVSPGQFAVYEEFARCLPGFLPSATPIATTITPGAGVSPYRSWVGQRVNPFLGRDHMYTVVLLILLSS